MTYMEYREIESKVRRRREVKAALAWLAFMAIGVWAVGMILG